MNLNELYLVRCHHEPFLQSRHEDLYVLKKDLEKLLRASYKLHVNPCRNPHSGVNCVKYTAIYVYDMGKFRSGQYWWTTPSLNWDKSGATVFDFANCIEHSFSDSDLISDDAFEKAMEKSFPQPMMIA